MQLNSQQPNLEPVARIPARTKRQAMDWGLVLASQGIDPVIEQIEDGRWTLVVPSEDYDKSVAAIRTYRVENLGWPWRKPIFKTHTIFDWGGAVWVLLTFAFYWMSDRSVALRSAGIMDGTATAGGEWWRLFTATLLHGDLAHLAANAVFGFILIGLAMGRYGTGVGLLAAFLTGAGGNVLSWLMRGDDFRGLGASGVVMGALGMLAAQSVALLRRHPNALRIALGGVAGGLMLFALLGMTPGTDIMAHFGGFISGLVLGVLLTLTEEWTTRPPVNFLASFIFTALVIWTWALALGTM